MKPKPIVLKGKPNISKGEKIAIITMAIIVRLLCFALLIYGAVKIFFYVKGEEETKEQPVAVQVATPKEAPLNETSLIKENK